MSKTWCYIHCNIRYQFSVYNCHTLVQVEVESKSRTRVGIIITKNHNHKPPRVLLKFFWYFSPIRVLSWSPQSESSVRVLSHSRHHKPPRVLLNFFWHSVGVLSRGPQSGHHKPPRVLLKFFLAFLTSLNPKLKSSVGVLSRGPQSGSSVVVLGRVLSWGPQLGSSVGV